MSDIHPATPMGSPALRPADDAVTRAAGRLIAENESLRGQLKRADEELDRCRAVLEKLCTAVGRFIRSPLTVAELHLALADAREALEG